ATATSTAVITPAIQARLGAIGCDITPIAGTAFTGAVAGFLDNNPNVPAATLFGSIDWGDGHTSAGAVSDEFGPFFAVRGSNTYDQAGTYTITVTIHDQLDNLDATATSTAFVIAKPALPPPDLGSVAITLTHTVEYLQNVLTDI